MGRGDKKTKKGKIFMGSFGKIRPARIAKPGAPAKKAEVKEEATAEVKEEVAAKPAKKAAKKED